VLPESTRRRVLAAIAEIQEREASAEQRTSRDRAMLAEPAESAVPAEPAAPAVSAEHSVPSERAGLLPRRTPSANGGPRPPTEVKRGVLPTSLPSLRASTEAPAEPFQSVSAVPVSDIVKPAVAEIAMQSASLGQRDGFAKNSVSGQNAADVMAASAKREVDQQAHRRKRPSGRRYRIAGALSSVATLVTLGSLALVLSGHTAPPAPRGHDASAHARGLGLATRNLAAAWVADQVSRAVVVSCDPVMCGVLKSHGFPGSKLYELGPDTTDPLRSGVIVATEAVRAQFGNLLSSVYAPAVMARFGSGWLRIDIREIAPRGPAAYRAAVSSDVRARKATGAQLLQTNRIAVSVTARQQLSAGQVDMRLLVAIAGMASVHPIYIVRFSNSAPGAAAGTPLRFADVAEPGRAGRTATTVFMPSMIKYLRTMQAPYDPERAQVLTSGGHPVLHIEFAAPSPFGLLVAKT
jgi:hypothetical protein